MLKEYKDRIQGAKDKQFVILNRFHIGDTVYPLWLNSLVVYGTVIDIDTITRKITCDFNGVERQFMPEDLVLTNPSFAKKAKTDKKANKIARSIVTSGSNINLPDWVVKTLKGCKKTAPYIFKAKTEYAVDYLEDLVVWCHKNGSPSSRLFNQPSGRFIKIADPLLRELELMGIVKE